MAQYTVNYSCGHTGNVALFGPTKDRYRRIEWLETKVCEACYKAQQEADRQAENERAAKIADQIGFPALTGSEKQIAWANSIRQACYESLAKRCSTPEDAADFVLYLARETAAKWWIDHRGDTPESIVRMIAANYPDGGK